MGNSVEYLNGVFVAMGPTSLDSNGVSGGSAAGTALMARPIGHLAAVDAPSRLVSAEFPPAGPTDSSSSIAAAGGRRRIALATVAVLLIAVMAFGSAAFGGGFGGGPSSSVVPTSRSAGGALGVAAAASMSASSVAFTLAATRTTPSTTTTLVDGYGAVDLTTNTAKMAATIPALSGLVGRGNDKVNVVTDGSTIYLGSPALSALPGNATWLKASLPKDTSNSDSSSLAVLANPSQLLGLLSSVGGNVITIDNVNLNGTSTIEYSTTVTLARLVSGADLNAGSRVGARLAQILRQLGNATVPITAWVGKDGFVRQISASLELSRATLGSLASDLISGVVNGAIPIGTSGQSTTATTVVVGFSHYNAPLTVTAPPASQTTDVNAVVHSIHGVISDIGHAVSNFTSKL
jgi:hypothetical protein